MSLTAQLVDGLVAAPGLLIRDWGEDIAVVYSPANISTHLISAEAAELLRLCSGTTGALEPDAVGVSSDTVNALLLSGLLRQAK